MGWIVFVCFILAYGVLDWLILLGTNRERRRRKDENNQR